MNSCMTKEIRNKTYIYDELAAKTRWEDFANQYETKRRLKIIFETLIEQSELKGKAFLDAGSGGGHFSQAANDYGAKVVSLDVGLHLLRQVEERCNSKKTVGSVLGLPFKKNYFDVVLCTDVIEHTPDPLYAVRELSSVIKKGGLLIITVPCRLWNPAVKLATALKLRPYEGYENFLWPGKLTKSVEKQGFSIEIMTGFNFCPFFSEKMDSLFNFFDKAYGTRMPWLMVNIGIRARKMINS